MLTHLVSMSILGFENQLEMPLKSMLGGVVH